MADQIQVRKGDANDEIKKLCRMGWKSNRAVLLLDPYAMQVEWDTIAAVAKTQAIELWVLFPLGIGVNRLLPPQRRGQRRLAEALGPSSGNPGLV